MTNRLRNRCVEIVRPPFLPSGTVRMKAPKVLCAGCGRATWNSSPGCLPSGTTASSRSPCGLGVKTFGQIEYCFIKSIQFYSTHIVIYYHISTSAQAGQDAHRMRFGHLSPLGTAWLGFPTRFHPFRYSEASLFLGTLWSYCMLP